MSINSTEKLSNNLRVNSDFLENGIISALADSSLVAVKAATGTGKSTKMVATIRNVDKSIMFITEPTIPACDNLARRMNSLLGQGSVGTAAEGIVSYNNNMINLIRNGYSSHKPDTRTVYCTIGHMKFLLFDLVRYGFEREDKLGFGKGFRGANMVFCDVLMIDEAGNGSLDNDITMILYKFLYNAGACVPRLVIASATLDILSTPFPKNDVYVVEGRAFPVEIFYHNTTYSLTNDKLYLETGKVIIERHKASPLTNTTNDIWLIFGPGKKEIEKMKKTVADAFSNDKTIELLLAHSEVDPDEMIKIESKLPFGKRRFIFATNIIETAITLEGVSGVFDTLTEKIQETASNGGSRLSLYNISKSSAQQRTGRTGRTKPGFCYRMMKEEDFEKLPNKRPNEIDRVPLHSTIITLMDVGLNPRELLKQYTSERRINESVSLMTNLEMLGGNPIQVTNQGRFATRLPLSPYGSASLYKWMQLRDDNNKALPIFPALSVIVLIDFFGPSYFNYKGVEGSLNDHYDKFFKKYDGVNDIVILGNMWNAILSEFKTADPDKRKLKKYNVENSLNNKKIIEVVNNIRVASNYLIKSGFPIVFGGFNTENVLKFLGPILIQVYSSRIFIRGYGDYYKSLSSNDLWMMEKNIEKMLKLEPTNSKKIIGLVTTEIPGRNDVKRIISLSLSTEGIPTQKMKTITGPKFIGAGIAGRLGNNLIIGRPKVKTASLPSLSSLVNSYDLGESRSALDIVIPKPFHKNIRIDMNGFKLPEEIIDELKSLPPLNDLPLKITEGSLATIYDLDDNKNNVDEDDLDLEEEEDDEEVNKEILPPITFEEQEEQRLKNNEMENSLRMEDNLLINSPDVIYPDQEEDD